MISRRAAVAGRFYPADPSQLRAELSRHVRGPEQRLRAQAILVPHAGYLYSGDVAGATYGAVQLPRLLAILGPNHRDLGHPISMMSEGSWQTPLGAAEIDAGLARRLLDLCHLVQESPLAHRDEHALEVQLPFLQHLRGDDFRFLPILVGTSGYADLATLGKALAEAIRQSSEPVLLIASSDMNHYEAAGLTLRKDQMAIEKILALDSRGLYDLVHRENVSMCGYGPTVSVIEAALLLGASRAQLVDHRHSGQVTGDSSSVVGYAGVVIH